MPPGEAQGETREWARNTDAAQRRMGDMASREGEPGRYTGDNNPPARWRQMRKEQ